MVKRSALDGIDDNQEDAVEGELLQPAVHIVDVIDNQVGTWTVLGNTDYAHELLDGREHPLLDLTKRSWLSARVSSRSVAGHSCNLPDPRSNEHSLQTGVACSVVQYVDPTRANDVSMLCEGITLFPPGNEWISRGLMCIGMCINVDPAVEAYFATMHSTGAVVGRVPKEVAGSLSSLLKCASIRQALRNINKGKLAPLPEVIETVDGLFRDFI